MGLKGVWSNFRTLFSPPLQPCPQPGVIEGKISLRSRINFQEVGGGGGGD